MRNMVTIDDIVVPVSLTLLQSSALKSERAFPGTGLGRFGRFLRKRKLTVVVVPRTKQVDGLDVRRRVDRKGELNGSHCSFASKYVFVLRDFVFDLSFGY